MLMLLNLWFLIGVIVLLVWRGEKWFSRRAAAFTDDREGEKYRYNEERSKAGLLMNLMLRFNLPHDRFFRLRRQGWFDRFGKGTRLAIEPEAGEPVFDDLFFLDSDDDDLVNLLMQKRPLRSLLIMYMTRLKQHGASLVSMDGENGELCMRIRVFSADDPARLREESVGWLKPFLDAIRELPRPTGQAHRARRATLDGMRSLGLALFAVGGAWMSWIWFMSPDRLVDPAALAQLSSVVGLVLFLALSLWAFRNLGRASNRHRSMVLWICLSLTGILGCSFALLRAANIHLDFARHEAINVDKAELIVSYKRRQGSVYQIKYRLAGWEPYRNEYATISWFEERRLRNSWLGNDSGPVTLRVHPGLLGFQWQELDP